jgi:tRNA-specific 2-thiouridylase
MRVLVAMSGGVDSSVAAAQMVEHGNDVVGVTLKLWSGPNGEAPTAGCCTVSDAEDARRVAAQLDIPYYVLDYSDVFMSGVVDRFVAEYASGRTPNPCVECNRTVKFDQLMHQAREFDCDVVVTGHYARVVERQGSWVLSRGVDPDKDQSYVLSMLGQDQLARIRFPVGDLTKAQTRAIAADLGLRTAHKADSQDICFVGNRDYRSFLADVAPGISVGGEFVDTDGTVLGRHDGYTNFTIGQRRGIGLALGGPRYVTHIDPVTATITLGHREDLAVQTVQANGVTWVSGDAPDDPHIEAQYRAHGVAAPAVVRSDGMDAEVEFSAPQLAIAAGQTIAFYRGDEVLGGGIIVATR